MTKKTPKRTWRISGINLIWLAAYAAVMTCIVLGMFHYRAKIQSQLADPQKRAEWEAWREDVRDQQEVESPEERGPVERRVPKSTIPPMFVLMNENFMTLLVAAVVAGSLLFGLLVFAVKGVVSRVELPHDASLDEDVASKTPPSDE